MNKIGVADAVVYLGIGLGLALTLFYLLTGVVV
jgi:hypothetical protein